MSNELIQDAVGLDVVLGEFAARAIAQRLDSLVVNGVRGTDGVLGLFQRDDLTALASATPPSVANVVSAATALRAAGYLPTAAIARSNEIAATKQTLVAAGAPTDAIDGVRLLETDSSDVANTVIVGDFSWLLLGMRLVEVSLSSTAGFGTNSTICRLVVRAECAVADLSAFRMLAP